MAYMTKEQKKVAAMSLKEIMPKGWRYSLRIENDASLIMTIQKAPIDFCAIRFESDKKRSSQSYNSEVEAAYYEDITNMPEHTSIHVRDLSKSVPSEYLDLFNKIYAVLNVGNYNDSDSYTDYFDVGHYVEINAGKWDKPFINTSK